MALSFAASLSTGLVLLCRGGGMHDSDTTCGASTSASLGESLFQRQVQKMAKIDPEMLPISSMQSLNGSTQKQNAAAGPMLVHVAPKVLRSMYDKTTLFYHVHIPKTGGTMVANLLVSDICEPEADTVPRELNWRNQCGKTCEMGFTDNMLICSDADRPRLEHSLFDVNFERAERLRVMSEAEKVVFVTTLRPGSARLISQWAAEVNYKTFVAPLNAGSGEAGQFGSESLRSYINGSRLGTGWIASNNFLARNNLQVATLASVSWDIVTPVTRQHLEQAKKTLLTGNWMIGFTGCMGKLHEMLMKYANSLNEGSKPKVMPHEEPGKYRQSMHEMSPEVLAEVEAASSLDTELFQWAWSMAQNSTDDRWAGTC